MRNSKGQVIGVKGEDKTSRYHIGQGVYHMPDADLDKKFTHMGGFGYLYKDGVKLSNIPFRQGGLFSGFKDQQYCSMIAYPKLFQKKPDTMGDHVIINTKGEIVLKAESCLDYPYFGKGVIGSIKNTYYNLETGKAIVKGSQTVKSKDFLFVETGYQSSYEKEQYEPGVYKIEYATGKFEIFN